MTLAVRLVPQASWLSHQVKEAGYNPKLQLNVNPSKLISSILDHLVKKWILPNTQSILHHTIRLFPSQLTNISWGLYDSSLTAGQAFEMLGKPATFQLQYGYLLIPNTRSQPLCMEAISLTSSTRMLHPFLLSDTPSTSPLNSGPLDSLSCLLPTPDGFSSKTESSLPGDASLSPCSPSSPSTSSQSSCHSSIPLSPQTSDQVPLSNQDRPTMTKKDIFDQLSDSAMIFFQKPTGPIGAIISPPRKCLIKAQRKKTTERPLSSQRKRKSKSREKRSRKIKEHKLAQSELEEWALKIENELSPPSRQASQTHTKRKSKHHTTTRRSTASSKVIKRLDSTSFPSFPSHLAQSSKQNPRSFVPSLPLQSSSQFPPHPFKPQSLFTKDRSSISKLDLKKRSPKKYQRQRLTSPNPEIQQSLTKRSLNPLFTDSSSIQNKTGIQIQTSDLFCEHLLDNKQFPLVEMEVSENPFAVNHFEKLFFDFGDMDPLYDLSLPG